MAILRWDQVVELTHDEARQILLDQLDGQGFTATSWQKFSIPSLLVGLGAEIMARGSKIAVFLKSLALNDTSEGESLRRFSKSHYANEFEAAVTAQRRFTFACTATEGPHPVDLGDIVVSHSDGPTFRNVEGLSVVYPTAIPSGGTLTLLMEAEVAGTAANFAAGELLTTAKGALVTTLSGVTITGDTVERDGVDDEEDDRLRTRNSTKWADLGQWELIRDRVESIALKSSAAIAFVGIDDANPRGAGTFDVYIAGELTSAGSSLVETCQDAFDLRVMGQYADGVVPRGQVLAAPPAELNLTATIYYSPEFAEADVIAAAVGVNGSLQAFLKTIPLGGFDYSPGPSHVVRMSDVEAALKATVVGGRSDVIRTVVTTNDDLSVASFGKVVEGTSTLAFRPVNAA